MYKTIDLFAGIGGIRLGFQYHGCETVFSSEWDKDAQKMYAENFGEIPFGDINLIAPTNNKRSTNLGLHSNLITK